MLTTYTGIFSGHQEVKKSVVMIKN